MARSLLRFTTAGSVDDGKSTLIGRLLYDSKDVYEDQLAAVRKSTVNRAAGPIDFSLLTDGLRAEREQGITIDVAYRYFATPRRKFIIADTPGHEQYTRNMATGASTADLAVVLIDARNGVSTQSRRHACIAALLGIPRVLVAVNKMDLVGFSGDVFERIRGEFQAHLNGLGIAHAAFIPVSALNGDNVVKRSAQTPWYGGATLLDALEDAPSADGAAAGPLRFPVQYVLRPDLDFRGYAGRVASGTLRVGDRVMALPSGRTSRVRSLPWYGGALDAVGAPSSATVCLEDELDISRGDMLVDPKNPPAIARRFEAKLVWMHEAPLKTGKPYLLKHAGQTVTAVVTGLAYRLDVNTLEQAPATQLEMNEIGSAAVETSRPLFFDAYATNRATGSFILIDLISNATLAAGMIESRPPAAGPEREAGASPDFVSTSVTPGERHARAGHLPAIVWIEGRPAVARLLEAKLFGLGCHVFAVPEDARAEALPDVARALADAGLIAIVSPPASAGAGGRGPGTGARASQIDTKPFLRGSIQHDTDDTVSEARSPGPWPPAPGPELLVGILELRRNNLAVSDEEAARQLLSELSDAGIVNVPGGLLGGEGI